MSAAISSTRAAQCILDRGSPGSAFHVANGPDLENLRALLRYLPHMTAVQWTHHEDDGRNHFADWISGQYGESELVREMRAATSPAHLARILQSYEGSRAGERPQAPVAATPTSASAVPPPGMVPSPVATPAAPPQVVSPAAPSKTIPPAKFASVAAPTIHSPATPQEGELELPPPSARLDDTEFAHAREDAAHRHEELHERYDEVARRLKTALDDPMDPALVAFDERLGTRYEELRQRATALRKEGKEVFIPTLQLRQFGAKRMLARATRLRDDFAQVQVLLDQAAFELEAIAATHETSLKEEILARSGITTGDPAQGLINRVAGARSER